MLEIIFKLKKMTFTFLKGFILNIEEIAALIKLDILTVHEAEKYLAFLIEQKQHPQEKEIIAILIAPEFPYNEKRDNILNYFSIEYLKKEKIHVPFYLIIQWIDQSKQQKLIYGDGFDLVETLYELLIFFDFPNYESKLFNLCLSEYKKVQKRIQEYLIINPNRILSRKCVNSRRG